MSKKQYKRHAFDAYCKRLVKNEAINIHKEYARRRKHEVSFSELSQQEWMTLQYIDQYAPERRVFTVLDVTIEISDGDLVRALSAISSEQRAVILLAYLLDMTDEDIARYLHLRRSTVQYRRKSTLAELQKLMEDYEHE